MVRRIRGLPERKQREYTVPLYPTGFGSTEVAVLDDGTTTDPVRLFTTGGTGQIPVVLILDEEGYIIAQQATGTPVDGWEKFDGLLNTALTEDISETFDSRIGWEEPETSFTAVFALGLILSILVYFSPCAFPVLPGFISYYLSLGGEKTNSSLTGNSRPVCPARSTSVCCGARHVDLLRHHRHRGLAHG